MKHILLSFILLTVYGSVGLAEEAMNEDKKKWKKAVFAGGCFWCMEKPYESYDGIKSVVSGYTGGEEENATYAEVSSGASGHREAVEVTYDPSVISYEKLLDIFWRQIDPTDHGGQFADRGFQYSTAIYYNDEQEKELAEQSKKKLEDSKKFDRPVATKIIEASTFYPAEEYHQDYYKKHPVHYNSYQHGSGRGPFLQKTWKGER